MLDESEQRPDTATVQDTCAGTAGTDPETLNAYGHYDNISVKALWQLYVDYLEFVRFYPSVKNLPSDLQEDLRHCWDFEEFSELMCRLKGTDAYEDIYDAIGAFSDMYQVSPDFWSEACLLPRSTLRYEKGMACGVEESASVLAKLLQAAPEKLGVLEDCKDMLDMLVKYCQKNASMVDDIAEDARKDQEELSDEWLEQSQQHKE